MIRGAPPGGFALLVLACWPIMILLMELKWGTATEQKYEYEHTQLYFDSLGTDPDRSCDELPSL